MRTEENAPSFVPFYEPFVSPDYVGWNAPGAPVVAWVAIHSAASALLAAVLVASAFDGLPVTALVGLGWIAAVSGLVLRLARHLLIAATTPVGIHTVSIRPRAISISAKAGCYLVITQIAYLAVRELGRDGVVLFAGVVALTVGIRVAGLDAWEGTIRPRFFYVRTVCSTRGLLNGLLVVACAGLAMWLPTLLLGSLATSDEPIWIFPTDSSWVERFGLFIVSLAALSLPTLLICEAIGLAARYDNRLTTLVLRQERELQQARVAGELHDRALHDVRRLRSDCSEPEHRFAASRLEAELRRLQRELEPQIASERPVRGCLARAFERANELGLEIIPLIDGHTLATVLDRSTAELLEAVSHEHVINSVNAQAATSWIEITIDEVSLVVRYEDDGGGYEPSVALERDGGLARLVRRVRASGGVFRFDARPGRTASVITLAMSRESEEGEPE